jgi:hypothetical protein
MKIPTPAYFISAALVLFWTAWFFIPSTEKTGQMGDKFGALNALFTGAALVGLVVTLYREAEAKSELASAITALNALKAVQDKQTKIQQEMFYLQTIASEINGIGFLFEYDRKNVAPEDYNLRVRKLHHEFVFAKHRAAEALGIVAPD